MEKPKPPEQAAKPEKLKNEVLKKSKDVSALKNLVWLAARHKKKNKSPNSMLKEIFKKGSNREKKPNK